MSVGEDRVIGDTLQSDDMGIVECLTVISFSSEWSKSRQVYSSVHSIITTSHYQFSWIIIILETECPITKSNGSQFRQVYSSFSLQAIHFQRLHENSSRMLDHQTEVTSSWASLFIISFFHNHSQTQHENNQRVNLPDREWGIDLPELTSIRLGEDAFSFKDGDDSSELIMRSGGDEMKWWIDLPKLTTLTTEGEDSDTFECPRSITLESTSYPSTLTNRHAFSHHCHSPSCI